MKKMNLDLDGIVDSDNYDVDNILNRAKKQMKGKGKGGKPIDIEVMRKGKKKGTKAKRTKDCGCK